MRLVVYGPQRRLGVLHDGSVIDVNAGYAKYLRESQDEPFPYEMASAIAPAELGDFIARCPVPVTGLMTMPPWPDAPEDSRRYFRELREIRDRLATPDRPLPHLSMGTTGDLEVAVEEGATLVRVGTALFGPRPGSPA